MQAANRPARRISGFGVFTAASYAIARSMATRNRRIFRLPLTAGRGPGYHASWFQISRYRQERRRDDQDGEAPRGIDGDRAVSRRRAACRYGQTGRGAEEPALGDVHLLELQHVLRQGVDARRHGRVLLPGRRRRHRPVGPHRQGRRDGLHPVPDQAPRRLLSLGHPDDRPQGHEGAPRPGRPGRAQDKLRQARHQAGALFLGRAIGPGPARSTARSRRAAPTPK